MSQNANAKTIFPILNKQPTSGFLLPPHRPIPTRPKRHTPINPPNNKPRRLHPKNLHIPNMNRYTIPTITELIIIITITLCHGRRRTTRCCVEPWEDAGFGGVADVLGEAGDVGWVAHLNYCYDWEMLVGWMMGERVVGKVLFFETDASRGAVALKNFELVPHITSPITCAPYQISYQQTSHQITFFSVSLTCEYPNNAIFDPGHLPA